MNAPQVHRLHNQFSSTAFRELRNCFVNFSSTNADAFLAASTLLSWQASSWQTWSALRSGIQSVCRAKFRSHNHLLTRWLTCEQALTIIQSKGYESELCDSTIRHTHLSPEAGITEHYGISETIETMGRTLQALQRLRTELADSETELYLTSGLIDLVRQLRSSYSARALEAQVNALGQIRQFLLWAPTHLLEQQVMGASTWIALSHFYATGAALEPVFSEWGPILCGNMALHSLEKVHSAIEIGVTESSFSKHSGQAVVLRRSNVRRSSTSVQDRIDT